MFNVLKYLSHKSASHDEDGRGKERDRRMALSAIFAVFAKVINTAIPLITLKITIDYLGTELYGLWATITSFFSLFAFADLGLGNGLQTELSRSTGKDDLKYSRTIISCAYYVLTLIPAVILLLFLIIYPFVNWATLFNAKTNETILLAGSFVVALFSSRMASIPTSLVQRIHNSLQEGYIASLWSCISSICSLIIIFVFWKYNFGKLSMMWASSYIIVFVYLINTLYFFCITDRQYRPSIKLINKKACNELLSTGLMFFVLSILTTISLSLDNFIVAKVIGLDATASYSVAYRIVLFIGIISTMLSTPLWTAAGEALSRGDYKWVFKRTAKMTKVSLWGSVICSILIILFTNYVLLWLNKGLYIPPLVTAGMCLTQIIIATTNPAFMVLNANRNIMIQIIMYSLYTVVSLLLKYYLGKSFGLVGISWMGAISYMLIILPILYIAYKKLQKRFILQ